jgi:dihydroorotate dehydrogenase electron transfer subunit
VTGPAAATAPEPRTLAPPRRREARVTGCEPLGAYRMLRALDDEGPHPRPGQFYMLAAPARWGGADGRPYLPRAFSYARARPAAGALQLEFVLEAVGPGTRVLAELREGELITLVGPLGVGFRPPADGGRALLVGGGIGVAPLICLWEELGGGANGPGAHVTAPSAPPEVLLGFRTAAHAEAAALLGPDAALATDDGSRGRRALVTDLLRERLDGGPPTTVYACGPPPMLESVRALCAARGVPAQLALESGMACGFGACFGCVVPTRDGLVRLCVEGPVLPAERLETVLLADGGHA